MLILDVESGSVGCALARITSGDALARQTGGPKLFAEARVALPVLSTLNSLKLIREIDITARELLAHVSLVAARLRGHEQVAHMGHVSSALVFLSPPWTSLVKSQGSSSEDGSWDFEWQHESAVVSAIRDAVLDVFGDIPISFHAFGTAAVHATDTLFQNQNEFLLCSVGGEMVELLLIDDGRLAGHATLPMGQHTLLRTLQHHAWISAQEAHSVLRLPAQTDFPNAYAEPFEATAAHLGKEFGDTVGEMLDGHFVHGILVIAPEPAGEWFARALASPPAGGRSLVEIFPQSTAVQALHTHHLAPHLAAHAAMPDLLLMLETLFASKKFNTVY